MSARVVKFEMDAAFLSIREERDRSDCLDIETFCSRIQHELGFDGISDMDLKSYSRWYDYSRARRDVPRHRHRLGAVVRRSLRR
jgi:polyphosphate kinase 2 (PPK2 family)